MQEMIEIFDDKNVAYKVENKCHISNLGTANMIRLEMVSRGGDVAVS
jgi:hypothetical protein